jgi:hypothetical protein
MKSKVKIYVSDPQHPGSFEVLDLAHPEMAVKNTIQQQADKQADKQKTAEVVKREESQKKVQEKQSHEEILVKEIQEQSEEENQKSIQKIQDEEGVWEDDAAAIRRGIKESFKAWNQKHEHEKTSDWEERLKTQSEEMFVKICVEQIQKKQRGDISQRLLSAYSSEKQLFVVSFKYKGIEWLSELEIPTAKAKEFEEFWDFYPMQISNADWAFLQNMLCPTVIILIDDSTEYELRLQTKGTTEISFSFDDFTIENPYLKGFVVSAEMIRNKLKENSHSVFGEIDLQ